MQLSLKGKQKQFQADVQQLHEHQNQYDPVKFVANVHGLRTGMKSTATKDRVRTSEEIIKFILADDMGQKPFVHERKDQPATLRPVREVH